MAACLSTLEVARIHQCISADISRYMVGIILQAGNRTILQTLVGSCIIDPLPRPRTLRDDAATTTEPQSASTSGVCEILKTLRMIFSIFQTQLSPVCGCVREGLLSRSQHLHASACRFPRCWLGCVANRTAVQSNRFETSRVQQ